MTDRSTGQQPGFRRRRRRNLAGRYALAGVLALAVHGLFVAFVLLAGVVQLKWPGEAPPAPPRTPSRPVALRAMSAEDWEKNRQVRDTPDGAEEEREVQVRRVREKPRDDERVGPLVQGSTANDEESPDAKFSAERNNRVEKETTAREKQTRYENAAPQRTAPVAREGVEGGTSPIAAQAGNGGRADDDKRQGGEQARRTFEVPSIRRQDQVALRTPTADDPDGMPVANRTGKAEVQGNGDRLQVRDGPAEGSEQAGGGEGRVGSPGIANLLPSKAAMDQIAGVAINDHDADDFEEGEVTALNTREWKYAGFMSRVHRAVVQRWDPAPELRRRDPTGDIYSGRSRTTVVGVELEPDGKVKRLHVVKSSGLSFLDLEAMQALEQAQPFPNVPTGMVGKDGTVKFAFGFTIDFGGGPSIRMFRQAN